MNTTTSNETDLYLKSLEKIGASEEIRQAAIAARTDDNFVPIEEREGRFSYKWKVECANHRPLMDYVFAANEDEAIQRAYERLEIPEGTELSVYRVNENNHLKFRLNAHQ